MINNDNCDLEGQKLIYSELNATKLNLSSLCCFVLRSINAGSLTFLLCELNDDGSYTKTYYFMTHNSHIICKDVLSILSIFNLLRLLTYVKAELIFHSADYIICIYLMLQDSRVNDIYNINTAQFFLNLSLFYDSESRLAKFEFVIN
jgi:hypothetical protein